MHIQAIIFDVGGVLNKGQPDFIHCFKQHGITLKEDLWANNQCKHLIVQFATGQYGLTEQASKQFFNEMRMKASLDEKITFEQFKQAWNSTILCLNYELLDNLHLFKNQGYRLFILSDSNLLHREYEETLYQQKYPHKTFSALFEKCYFSHETGHYKGFSGKKAHAAWLQILHENHLQAHECLFVDDKIEHIKKAKLLGLSTLHYHDNCTIKTLFDVLNLRP
ncbi:MAG: HAD-IA family hydrolase [Legionellaceae bacterium]|nr:HAD-IA family hydrolase [Legionellaceae bacterium]